MGQYYYVANLDKKEFLHPHRFGDGLKLIEFGTSGGGTMMGLAVLLTTSNGKGGGDLRTTNAEVPGRWAGDRIAVIGDYADGAEEFEPERRAMSGDDATGEWTDISDMVRSCLAEDEWVAGLLEPAI